MTLLRRGFILGIHECSLYGRAVAGENGRAYLQMGRLHDFSLFSREFIRGYEGRQFCRSGYASTPACGSKEGDFVPAFLRPI